MTKLTILILVAAMTLGACSTRLNPFNWFGRGQSEPVQSPQDTKEKNPLIPESERLRLNLFGLRNADDAEYPGGPIDQVSDLVIERVPGGAVIRVSGVADYQGAYGVRLQPANEDEVSEDGVLTYRLEVIRPNSARVGGPERVRTVTAARRVTDNQLVGVRTIRVEGLRNAQTSRRR
ncbi:hypothetical protein [uncultured Tateyamaria sp.]|uniref:hypothetical protein n=1 Tax=Tateyamaria sp. 1078 TaxID=3417464 RepID=UPI0026363615|nr:hypothetical protein [uncultured Tateyamaria sp.]